MRALLSVTVLTVALASAATAAGPATKSATPAWSMNATIIEA